MEPSSSMYAPAPDLSSSFTWSLQGLGVVDGDTPGRMWTTDVFS